MIAGRKVSLQTRLRGSHWYSKLRCSQNVVVRVWCVCSIVALYLADAIVVEKSERLSDLLVGVQLGVSFLHCIVRLLTGEHDHGQTTDE